MPGRYTFLRGTDEDTFIWYSESDKQKNARNYDGLDDAYQTSSSIFQILEHYQYSYYLKKGKKRHVIIMANLVTPKIDFKNYGKNDIDLAPFSTIIAQETVRCCQGGGTKLNRKSRKEFVREVLRERFAQVKQHKKEILMRQKWTRSTVFYLARTNMLVNGYAPEELNRDTITTYIEEICDEWRITREDLGIFAADRAQLHFKGQTFDVSFDDLDELVEKGSDMVIIEKEGAGIQFYDYADRHGIALLNPRGFLVDYAIQLAERADGCGCNVAILTDLDYSGLLIASKLPRHMFRIGINFETLTYFHLNREEVEEPYSPTIFDRELVSHLASKEELDYLEFKRIEIDSVMAAVNDNEKFWQYILDSLRAKFPTRDYNRAVDIPEYVMPTVLTTLNEMVKKIGVRLTQTKRNEMKEGYTKYEGFLDDMSEEDESNAEILKTIVETDKQIMGPLLKQIEDLVSKHTANQKIDDLKD